MSAERQTPLALVPHSVPQAPLNDTLAEPEPLRWRLVRERREAALRNEFLARYHPLGHRQPLGCHLRYFLQDRQWRRRGCLLFPWVRLPCLTPKALILNLRYLPRTGSACMVSGPCWRKPSMWRWAQGNYTSHLWITRQTSSANDAR